MFKRKTLEVIGYRIGQINVYLNVNSSSNHNIVRSIPLDMMLFNMTDLYLDRLCICVDVLYSLMKLTL